MATLKSHRPSRRMRVSPTSRPMESCRLELRELLSANGLEVEELAAPVATTTPQVLSSRAVTNEDQQRWNQVQAAKGTAPQPADFPLGSTFFLSSRPSATKTIYLDFNGHTTSGTLWNSQSNNNQPFTQTAYSVDGDANAFSDLELENIQNIWQRVAEDFAPFDVNVTTQQPSDIGDLINSGGGDSRWGVRVVIGSTFAPYASAGGVAYLTSFNYNTDTPALVFEDNLGNGDVKFTAEATTHEVGHSLGLSHDGRTSPAEEYYGGQGSGATGWAPIMGVGYYQPVVQWSRGEYTNPSQTQDDLNIITTSNGFGYRADDASNTTVGSPLLSGGVTFNGVRQISQPGVIEQNTDVDFFSFVANGAVNLQATGAGGFNRDSNLDILLEVYDSFGNRVAVSNPGNSINAGISANLPAGTYYLKVDGVGAGRASDVGYSDYGSLGQYTITGTVNTNGSATIYGQAYNDINADGTLNGADIVLANRQIYVDANNNGL